jgi:hypothetical protein
VPADVQQRIATENDPTRIERWLEAAVAAKSVTEIFSDA